MDLISKMLQIVVEAHNGQMTKNGVPYVTHPLWVASTFNPDLDRDLYLAALGHDLFEMTSVSRGYLGEVGVPERVIGLIEQLTRLPHETYNEYIDRVSRNQDASRVKLADISHHLYRHRMGESLISDSLVKRYESAIFVLTATKQTEGPLV